MTTQKKSAVVAVSVMALAALAMAAPMMLELPKPADAVGVDLMTALKGRHTTREFDATRAIPDDVLANVLWAATGVNRPESGKFTVPTALGLDYMRLLVCRADGAYRYVPGPNSLAKVSGADLRGKVGAQPFVGTAPVVLIIATDLAAFDGARWKIADTPRREMSHAVAGCIAQNIYLMAEAQGLGTVMAASLKEDAVRAGFELKDTEIPLYVMPLGYPKAAE